MKKILLLPVLLCLLGFISCQKVIDVDLNDKSPGVVVEGRVIFGDTIQRVKITKTLNFDESIAYPTVNNAIVSVIDNLGNGGTYTLVSDGNYELVNYPVYEGRTYTLTVSIDGVTYVASSTCPTAVDLPVLYIAEFVFASDTFRAVLPLYTDPAGESNYYFFDLFDNNEKAEGVFVQDDQFSDGGVNTQPLFGESFEPGDEIKVDMYCIDKPVWTYFNQLSVNTNGSGAAPANPTSNFSGGCLGYFSACSRATSTVIVPG